MKCKLPYPGFELRLSYLFLIISYYKNHSTMSGSIIGIMVRVFTNGPGVWGSIPGWVIPKTQKMLLEAPLLDTQRYKVWIKRNRSIPRKEVAPPSTSQCSRYWKGSPQVALDNSQPTYIYIYIYLFIYLFIVFYVLK